MAEITTKMEVTMTLDFAEVKMLLLMMGSTTGNQRSDWGFTDAQEGLFDDLYRVLDEALDLN